VGMAKRKRPRDPDVHERIATWARLKDRSFQDLANAAGVSVAAVYQWVGTKSTKTKPQLSHLEAIVADLGLTMEQFYGPLPAESIGVAS
jgi:transcriptional regulator with XRE-family HTH domain